MNKIELKARAKINITLDVLRRREDGYHDVKMIMQTVNLYDTLYLERIAQGIEIKTNLAYLPVGEGNIAYKAAKLFLNTMDLANEGIHIHIKKMIPVAAGLAGGSTDAAAVLIGMNKMYNTGLSQEQLMDMGKKLGADVPYCIMGGTALAEGIGEVLTSLPAMPECIIVLAKPPVSVSTAHVYNSLKVDQISVHPDAEAVINAIYNKDLPGIANGMHNVLEAVTTKEHKVINRIKNIMLGSGALASIMSGSGPTVFGVFEHEVSARKAVSKLKTIVRDVFAVNTYNSNEER